MEESGTLTCSVNIKWLFSEGWRLGFRVFPYVHPHREAERGGSEERTLTAAPLKLEDYQKGEQDEKVFSQELKAEQKV